MESESHISNEEAVLVQEQDLNKVENAAQSPNFELHEAFTTEDNFDDGCSSTTGASGCRDASISPQRFGNITCETNTEVIPVPESNIINIEFKNPETVDISKDDSIRVASEIYMSGNIGNFSKDTFNSEGIKNKVSNSGNIPSINAEISDGVVDPIANNSNEVSSTNNDLQTIEFLSRQKALDRANVFLRWNLSPTKHQILEFLEMVQGKLNLSMISEKGYDYCLLYFELLRDGLISYHLWKNTTVEELEKAVTEARKALTNTLVSTPPHSSKRRKVNKNSLSEENTSNRLAISGNSERIPLHILTNKRSLDSEEEAVSEFQGTPITSFHLAPSERSDENEDKIDSYNEEMENSYAHLEWQDANTNSSKGSDTSVLSKNPEENGDLNGSVDKESDSDVGDAVQENEGNSSRQDAMNRLLNPKSGCKGVSWSNRQMAWLAFWKEDNQRRSKTFSARKLGFEEAQRRAIEFLRRKREEVRMKTQAHLYEELPRVGSSTLNSTGESSVAKTPNRRSYSSSNATTTATPATPITPSFELDQFTGASHQFIPGFDESTRNIITGGNPLFGTNGNILANNVSPMINHGTPIQQGVIQSNIGQQNILTATAAAAAAAAAAAHHMGLPFHLAALSSITGAVPIDTSLSTTVASTGMNIGIQNPQQNQTNAVNSFTHAALMAANPFFMFSAAAAAAAVGSNSGHLGSNNTGSQFHWQQFSNGEIGSLIQNQIQIERTETTASPLSLFGNSNVNSSERKSDLGEACVENNAINAINVCNPARSGEKGSEQENPSTPVLSGFSKTEVMIGKTAETLLPNTIRSVPKSEEGAGSLVL